MNANTLANSSRNLDASAPVFVPIKASNGSVSRKNPGAVKKERGPGGSPTLGRSGSLHTKNRGKGAGGGKNGKAKGGGAAKARQPRGSRGGGGSKDRRQKQELIDEFFEPDEDDLHACDDLAYSPDTQQALMASLVETGPLSSPTRNARQGSNRSRSGRLNNANHLLNFQYEMPHRQQGSRGGGSSGNSGGNRRKNSKRWQETPAVHVSKEQYLQASFRFMVYPEKDAGALQEAFINPDVLVDWETVEQVMIFSEHGDQPHSGMEDSDTVNGGLPNCPVCLDQPRVPKITRCGHIFCVVCVLRHLGGETSKRCPMCFEQVSKGDLRAVGVQRQRSSIRPGVWVDLPLLRRARASLAPELAAGLKAKSQGLKETSGVFVEGDQRGYFSRLVISHPQRVSERMDREGFKLLRLKEECIACGETEFVPYYSEAIELLCSRRKLWKEKDPESIMKRFGDPIEESEEAEECKTNTNACGGIFEIDDINLEDDENLDIIDTADEVKVNELQTSHGDSSVLTEVLQPASNECFGDAWGSPDDTGLLTEREDSTEEVILEAGTAPSDEVDEPAQQVAKPEEPKSCLKPPTSGPTSEYSFYQISNGQWAFLHPLNMRCLLEDAGGNTSKLPEKIHAKIVEVETHRLTSELRRRLAFLGHLPEHCLIHFLELDLQAHLSDTTLKIYGGQIKKRHLARKKKERQQVKLRREEVKENLAHQALMEAQRNERNRAIDLSGPLPSEAAAAVSGSPGTPSLMPTTSPSNVEQNASGVNEGQNAGSPGEGWSFSRVTSSGYFPSLGETMGGPKSPQQASAVSQTAWGSVKKNESSPWFKDSAANIRSEDAIGTVGGSATKSKKKKGKPHKISLFSNSSARKY